MTETELSPLTRAESGDLEKLESVIQNSLNEMEAAGQALIEIRDRKLYREEFSTFKEYVQSKWEMSWKQAYRLCDAASVVENIKKSDPLGHFPTHERQTRVLAQLEPEQQVAVWTEAVKTGNTTAKGIEQVAEIIVPERVKKQQREPRRKGSYADWQQFRDLCIQIEEAVDEMEGLVVDSQNIITARDLTIKLRKRLERITQNLQNR